MIGREDAGTYFKVGAHVSLVRPSLGVALSVAADLTERAEVKVGVADPVFYRRGGSAILRDAARSQDRRDHPCRTFASNEKPLPSCDESDFSTSRTELVEDQPAPRRSRVAKTSAPRSKLKVRNARVVVVT